MLLKILLTFVLCCATAYADSKPYTEWDTQDKVQLTTYTVLSVMDYKQTSWALKQRDEQGNYIYHEANPLLGNRPSDGKLAAAQLLGVGVMYYDIKHNADEHRKLRWVVIFVKAAVVLHNDNIGITFNKAW